VAFLPFVILAVGVFLLSMVPIFLAVAVLMTVGGAEGTALPLEAMESGVEAVVEGTALVPRYYRLLARQRHPIFWGIPLGVLIGGVLLWALIGYIMIPGESRTVQILAETKQQVERVYGETKQFPRPDRTGHLPTLALVVPGAPPTPPDVVMDGFGRPLVYAVSGQGPFAAYTMTSWGFDGRPGRDDLCVSGAARLRQWAGAAASLLLALTNQQDSYRQGLVTRLQAVRAFHCPEHRE
jgi:hypothetical protein